MIINKKWTHARHIFWMNNEIFFKEQLSRLFLFISLFIALYLSFSPTQKIFAAGEQKIPVFFKPNMDPADMLDLLGILEQQGWEIFELPNGVKGAWVPADMDFFRAQSKQFDKSLNLHVTDCDKELFPPGAKVLYGSLKEPNGATCEAYRDINRYEGQAEMVKAPFVKVKDLGRTVIFDPETWAKENMSYRNPNVAAPSVVVVDHIPEGLETAKRDLYMQNLFRRAPDTPRPEFPVFHSSMPEVLPPQFVGKSPYSGGPGPLADKVRDVMNLRHANRGSPLSDCGCVVRPPVFEKGSVPGSTPSKLKTLGRWAGISARGIGRFALNMAPVVAVGHVYSNEMRRHGYTEAEIQGKMTGFYSEEAQIDQMLRAFMRVGSQ